MYTRIRTIVQISRMFSCLEISIREQQAYVIFLYKTISFVSLMELRSCILKMQTFCNVLKHVIYHLNVIILIGKQMHMATT